MNKKLLKCVLAENNSNNQALSGEIIDEESEDSKIDYLTYLKPGYFKKLIFRQFSKSKRNKIIRKWNFS